MRDGLAHTAMPVGNVLSALMFFSVSPFVGRIFSNDTFKELLFYVRSLFYVTLLGVHLLYHTICTWVLAFTLLSMIIFCYCCGRFCLFSIALLENSMM